VEHSFKNSAFRPHYSNRLEMFRTHC